MSSDDSESNGFSNLIPLLACIGIAVAMGFFFMGRIAPPGNLTADANGYRPIHSSDRTAGSDRAHAGSLATTSHSGSGPDQLLGFGSHGRDVVGRNGSRDKECRHPHRR